MTLAQLSDRFDKGDRLKTTLGSSGRQPTTVRKAAGGGEDWRRGETNDAHATARFAHARIPDRWDDRPARRSRSRNRSTSREPWRPSDLDPAPRKDEAPIVSLRTTRTRDRGGERDRGEREPAWMDDWPNEAAAGKEDKLQAWKKSMKEAEAKEKESYSPKEDADGLNDIERFKKSMKEMEKPKDKDPAPVSAPPPPPGLGDPAIIAAAPASAPENMPSALKEILGIPPAPAPAPPKSVPSPIPAVPAPSLLDSKPTAQNVFASLVNESRHPAPGHSHTPSMTSDSPQQNGGGGGGRQSKFAKFFSQPKEDSQPQSFQNPNNNPQPTFNGNGNHTPTQQQRSATTGQTMDGLLAALAANPTQNSARGFTQQQQQQGKLNALNALYAQSQQPPPPPPQQTFYNNNGGGGYLDDRSFVADGLVPGLRPPPPPQQLLDQLGGMYIGQPPNMYGANVNVNPRLQQYPTSRQMMQQPPPPQRQQQVPPRLPTQLAHAGLLRGGDGYGAQQQAPRFDLQAARASALQQQMMGGIINPGLLNGGVGMLNGGAPGMHNGAAAGMLNGGAGMGMGGMGGMRGGPQPPYPMYGGPQPPQSQVQNPSAEQFLQLFLNGNAGVGRE